MSDPQERSQFSASDVLQATLSSPLRLSIIAASVVLVSLFVPVVGISASFLGLQGPAVLANGIQFAGWIAWVTLFAFVFAAAARFAASLERYKDPLDFFAFAMAIIAVLWGLFSGPVVEELEGASRIGGVLGGVMTGVGGTNAASFSMYPHIGTLLFLSAPVFLFRARRCERKAFLLART